MSETISGTVQTVIDSNTIELKVMSRGKDNRKNFKDLEQIKISNINNISGLGSIKTLEDILPGMVVRCTVHSRDEKGRVVADIMIYSYK
jgi:endonuclease YncB( thermonuclease family)